MSPPESIRDTGRRDRRRGARMALAVLVAVIAGASLRSAIAHDSQPLGNDSFQYLLLARSIADGRGYVSGGSQHPDLTRPPALPVATAMASKLTGDVETAGILVSVLAGALLVLPLAALARGTFGRRAGWAAMPLAAVSCVMAPPRSVLQRPGPG